MFSKKDLKPWMFRRTLLSCPSSCIKKIILSLFLKKNKNDHFKLNSCYYILPLYTKCEYEKGGKKENLFFPMCGDFLKIAVFSILLVFTILLTWVCGFVVKGLKDQEEDGFYLKWDDLDCFTFKHMAYGLMVVAPLYLTIFIITKLIMMLARGCKNATLACFVSAMESKGINNRKQAKFGDENGSETNALLKKLISLNTITKKPGRTSPTPKSLSKEELEDLNLRLEEGINDVISKRNIAPRYIE